MKQLINTILTVLKNLVLTIILIPIAILFVILTYSGVIFGVIYYLWVKPEIAYELWNKVKSGIKNGTLIKGKLFYLLVTIGLILIILSYIFGRL